MRGYRSGPRGAIFRKRTPRSLAKYGLTVEEYERLEDEADGLCAICRKARRLAVDHCHDTGEVRGLICHKCNSGLGMFQDNPGALMAAAQYLLRAAPEYYAEPQVA